MSVETAFLSEINADEIYGRLKSKIEQKRLLTDEELMQLIILPLSEDIVLFAPGYSRAVEERLRKEIML